MTPKCNICGRTVFSDFRGRASARCDNCGALERTRMLALHLHRMELPDAARILHIAPEKGLFDLMQGRPGIVEYVAADFSPELYHFTKCRRIDLCDLDEWPSDHFDLVLHSHVLEHTQCNIAYTLFHLHRMLSPRGRHVFIVPFAPGAFEESFRKLTSEERTRRFGQWDHVRRFGVEDIGDHIGSILRLPGSFDAEDIYGRATLDEANIPEQHWRGFHGSTVLDIGKADYLLQ